MSEKLQGGLLAGSVDVSIPVVLRSTTNNTEVTGKVSADVTASYWRQGGSRTAIPAVALAAVDSAHSDGGFKEIDSVNIPGIYRFDLPDAAIAAGADWVVISIKVAGCYVFFQMFNLTGNLITTGAGAISWPYTLTDEATGLPIADVDVWVTTDISGVNVVAQGRTNASGVVTFYLDTGTVYIWRQKSGWDFVNPDAETVT